MRPLREDIATTADGNGNASIRVKLPVTGEWHNVKVAVQTTNPAEWAVVVSGTPVTFGAGRRVTLGPELIRDGETLVITCAGAFANGAITGAVSGVSGSPAEMLASFTPQPNTVTAQTSIPLEVQLFPVGAANTNQGQPSFVAGAGSVGAGGTFNVPIGTRGIRIAPHAPPPGNTFTYTMQVIAYPVTPNSMLLWPPAAAPSTAGTPSFPAHPVRVSLAPAWAVQSFANPQGVLQVAISVNGDPSVALNFFVSALFDVQELDVGAQFPLPISAPSSLPVTVQNLSVPVNVTGTIQEPTASIGGQLAAVSTGSLLAGTAGQVVKIFGWFIEVDQAGGNSIGWLEDDSQAAGTASARLAAFSSPGNSGGSGGRAGPVTTGAGVRMNVPLLGAGGTVRFGISYDKR